MTRETREWNYRCCHHYCRRLRIEDYNNEERLRRYYHTDERFHLAAAVVAPHCRATIRQHDRNTIRHCQPYFRCHRRIDEYDNDERSQLAAAGLAAAVVAPCCRYYPHQPYRRRY